MSSENIVQRFLGNYQMLITINYICKNINSMAYGVSAEERFEKIQDFKKYRG